MRFATAHPSGHMSKENKPMQQQPKRGGGANRKNRKNMVGSGASLMNRKA